MRLEPKRIPIIFYHAGKQLLSHHGMESAGYLSFLSMLAIFPFIVVLAAVAGWFGQGDLGRNFIELVMHHLPNDAVSAIRPRIWEIVSGPPQSVLTLSILGALWVASSAVEGLRSVLNRAYQVGECPPYLMRRVISILQILLLSVLVIVVMSVMVFAPLALQFFTRSTGIVIPDAIEHFFNKDFLYIGTIALFAAVASLYYWLPNIQQTRLSVLPGALLVVILWVCGAGLLSFYLDKISNVNLIYGSLSSLIITMLFFYVMNVIFIYGAEFNHQLMLEFNQRIVEKEAPRRPRKRRAKRAKAKTA